MIWLQLTQSLCLKPSEKKTAKHHNYIGFPQKSQKSIIFKTWTHIFSYCCYNKWPQTWWLKTTQTYCLTGLDGRNLNESYGLTVRVWGSYLYSFWELWGDSVPCLFQFLEASHSSWLVPSLGLCSSSELLLSLYHLLSLWPFAFPLIRTLTVTFG